MMHAKKDVQDAQKDFLINAQNAKKIITEKIHLE